MFRMYTGVHDEEYRLMDSLVEEQYLIGGVTGWLYAYQGPKGTPGSTDSTKPDIKPGETNPHILGNYIWMENSSRSYSVDAVSLPLVYQTQDASMDLQIPGLFLFETMDITLPYNLMIERLGRKIMKGDVLELANLRDMDLLDEDDVPINRFYVVHDAFKSGDGYSHTWFHHIWKLRVVPMVDSPEFKDLLGDGSHPDDLKNSLSSYQKELNIMDLIVGNANSEAPYMHWDNEHIHQAVAIPDKSEVPKGVAYPAEPKISEYFIKQHFPDLYDWVNNAWKRIEVQSGAQLPVNASDGTFFWHTLHDNVRPYVLLQYNANSQIWNEVKIEEGDRVPLQSTATGYFLHTLPDSAIMQFDGDEWIVAVDEKPIPYINNKHNEMDYRETPPNMANVLKGAQFPQDVADGTFFMRTDSTPPVMWKFENNKWRKYNQGGRMTWTGTDSAKASFVNNMDTYTDSSGNVHSSRVNSADALNSSDLLRPQL